MTDCFHRFPDLAPELRVKIWKFQLHVPRRIRLIERSISHCEFCDNGNYYKYVEMEGPPALLSVNQESRYESLREYQHVQRTEVCGPMGVDPCEQHSESVDRDDLADGHDLRRGDTIYINLSLDIIHFSYDDKSPNFLWASFLTDRIEHVEVTTDSAGWVDTPHTFTDRLLSDFHEWEFMKSLKLLINFTEPDPLVASNYMNRFMTLFEISIYHWHAWRFPKLTVVSKETGIILAERQPCFHDKVQQSYEWKIMGVNMVVQTHDDIMEEFGLDSSP